MPEACESFRRRLVAGESSGCHAESCSECQTFAQDWSRIEQGLQGQTKVPPPADFAARVGARLPRQSHPVATLALQTLPATLALLLALSIWVAVGEQAVGDENELVSADDYITWMFQDMAATEDTE